MGASIRPTAIARAQPRPSDIDASPRSTAPPKRTPSRSRRVNRGRRPPKSQTASLRARQQSCAGNDQVIHHPHVDHRQRGLQCLRENLVGVRWRASATARSGVGCTRTRSALGATFLDLCARPALPSQGRPHPGSVRAALARAVTAQGRVRHLHRREDQHPGSAAHASEPAHRTGQAPARGARVRTRWRQRRPSSLLAQYAMASGFFIPATALVESMPVG